MNRHDTAFEYFKSWWKVRMAKNEHLIKPCWHNLLSAVVRDEYSVPEGFMSPKVPIFVLQRSGTGKGHQQKLLLNLVEAVGLKGKILTSFTTAGVIGTIWHDKNNAPNFNQPLADYDMMCIDEASQATSGGSEFTRDFVEPMNGYLDNQIIDKALAKGSMRYKGKAVLNMGSYVEGSIKDTVLRKGFFQRFWVCFKEISRDEARQMRREIPKLRVTEESTNASRELIKILSDVKTQEPRIIKLGKEQEKLWEEEFEKLEELDTSGLTNVHLEAFDGALSRAQKLAFKILTQYECLNSSSAPTPEGIRYSIDCVKEHLESFIALLRYIADKDNGTAEAKTALWKNAKKRVLVFLEQKGNISRKDLLEARVGIGVSLSDKKCDVLMTELEQEKKIIKKQKGEHHETIYEISVPHFRTAEV